MRRPFFRKSHKCWYVKDDSGNFVRLDPDEETAHDIWQQMRTAASALAHPNKPFCVLVEAWLNEFQPTMTEQKFDLVANYLGQFVDYSQTQYARDITPSEVLKWIKEPKLNHKGRKVPRVWKLGTQRDAASCVKRVLNWSVEKGYLAINPIAGIKLKSPKSRVRTITPDEHKRMIEACRSQKVNGQSFSLYLIASSCGARPQQIRNVTAAHVHRDGKCWVFTEHKTVDKTGKPLIVYLNPCLQAITKMLIAKRPTGPLFTMDDGTHWKKDTVVRRMSRLRKKLKISDVVAYSYRHTFATNALLEDVPIATVSALLGHVDTRMVSRNYGHLEQHQEHLVQAAAQVSMRRR
jgi:integrase